ncbi:NUDIX domain-containing protein [Microlunatus soli]|uniref:NUDIX domain-containing protein n=1 Tax=Microlunatus soli TaxID=630515 RepID=A0A1H1TF64_9ACTN|nr:NUDIX hydrolase [Microlunatus soli]SDS58179.1 NUDIX domain-containing protein [Microlunatus soli]
MLNRREFLATLPRRRLAAGAIIRDRSDRVCLVEPTYREHWLLPGGTVEADESPRSGCAREVLEELGLDLTIGAMLCMEWVAPDGTDDPHGALMFCYDGGVLDESVIASIVTPPDELHGYRFVPVAELGTYTNQRNRRRIEAAVAAIGGPVAELEPA